MDTPTRKSVRLDSWKEVAAYLKRVTDQGLMLLLTCSDPNLGSVAPHGGRRAVFTPNPVAGRSFWVPIAWVLFRTPAATIPGSSRWSACPSRPRSRKEIRSCSARAAPS